MKTTIKKITKLIISRSFYLTLGIAIALTISIAYAAWNTTVNPGDSLTATRWNEHVNKLIDLNSKIGTFNSYWSLSGSTLSTPYNVYANSYSGPGCDIAERYLVDNNSLVEPGDIVVLDKDRKIGIKKSDTAFSTLVIGVISTNPNLIMGSLEDFDSKDQPPVALLGRVPTKVTTENGAIEIGDNIVTSSKPGYGMKCDDYSKCQGAIVGKALENLESGEGMIEVLISTGF